MLLSDVSVKRPVFAVVLSLLLCIFGAVAFMKLGVREMPDVEKPVVTVATTYTGASATIIESQITKPIEDQLTGISGIDTITSVTRNGKAQITITFEIGWDMVEGVSDVRDAVAKAERFLPDDADEPLVMRNNGSGQGSVYVMLRSESMDRMQLTDYAQRTVEDTLALIPGVSSVQVSGGLEQVMYLQLQPELLAGRDVTVQEITNALRAENIEAPGGQIRNDVTTMTVRTDRLYRDAEDFQYLVIKRSADGQPIYLKDVAEVFVGAKNEDSSFTSNGEVNINLSIITQSDANPLDVAKAVYAEVEKMQRFLPEGTELAVEYDKTIFIERSIEEVYSTLIMTGLLVILVLYIFIGQARATLIPAVTVPVSLIASFIFAYAFGFSINLLTLMALILAIGLVVDDAIVVVENVFHHIEQGKHPLLAAYQGTREVGFAVIATTLVLVMVFIPITFMEGMVGLMFTEFAVTLSMAVIFSSLIALTLTPAMASFMLKSNLKQNAFNRLVDRSFGALENGYRKIVILAVRFRFVAPLVIIGCIVGAGLIVKHIPMQLAPSDDRGLVLVFVKGAEGTSYNRMAENMQIVEDRLMPLLNQGVVRAFNAEAPAFKGSAGDQTGFVILILEDWNERTVSAKEALKMVQKALTNIPDVRVRAFLPGFGGGSSEPVQFILNGGDYAELYQHAQALVAQAQDDPNSPVTGFDIDYSESTPELVVDIDRQRAAELGISVNTIAETLEVMLGGKTATTYVERGEEYDVYLRGSEASFGNAEDLSKIYLRTASGEVVSLDSVVSLNEVASPIKLSHTNKQKSITIKATLKGEASLGEALDYLDAKALAMLPAGITIDYAGESKDFRDNQSSAALVFGLALLVAYLVLAAQFESFINPLVVMFTVPMGIVGGLFGLFLMQETLNIYSQIGMIMLIGMVTKNGILIVEFTNQLRDRGYPLDNAIIEASVRRLRPIMMTAFTTLIGAIPLILSTGAGAESRIGVGTVVFAGMAFSTVITLVVIPGMYRLMSGSTKSPEYRAQQLELLEAEQQLQVTAKSALD